MNIPGVTSYEYKNFNHSPLNEEADKFTELIYMFAKKNRLIKTLPYHGSLTKIEAVSLFNRFFEESVSAMQGFSYLSFLQERQKIEKKSISCSEFAAICENTLVKVIEIAAKNISIQILSHQFQDQRIQGMIDCLKYAFYLINEPQAHGWVYERGCSPVKGCYVIEYFTEVLGYSIVDVPEKGDIVLYCDEDFHPRHIGIFFDSKTVHSKWGQIPQLFLHPIEAVPRDYGRHYLIFHKEKD
jgi:hypothetical protein